MEKDHRGGEDQDLVPPRYILRSDGEQHYLEHDLDLGGWDPFDSEEEAIASARLDWYAVHRPFIREELRRLQDAVLAYDAAIRACANDPSKMATHTTAQGDDLDTLYERMVRAAGGKP